MSYQEWLGWRKKGIGGSDVAPLAGLSKYKSRVGVWLEKTGRDLPTEEESQAARFGRKLEPVVADEFAERTGFKIEPVHEMLQHSTYPFMLANLDRAVHVDGKIGVLECKTADKNLSAEWVDEKIPDAYMLQVQHYLAVTGLDFAYIAVLIGGNDFKYKPIDRDQEMIDQIIEIEKSFWKLVEDETPPIVDGSEATTKLLKSLYPESNGQEIFLPENALEWVEQYHRASEQIKEFEFVKNEAYNLLLNAMEDNALGWIGEKKVTKKVITEAEIQFTRKAYTRLYIPKI